MTGLLGAVLAGGQSSRFGSDKALAVYRGAPLLDHAVAGLARWCDAVVVAGRDGGVPDWPEPGMGPLGGLAGALIHAQDQGFDAVLAVSVDAVLLPDDLLERLAPGPSFVADQPVVGLWPVSVIGIVQDILRSEGRHSLRALAERSDARAVQCSQPLANINTRSDLDLLENDHGL
ncbi:MAG: molybdenum cofactor guanylyltransferase [Novosphingobium sp.]|uniref:molybdenum cofactor guanylyltransferase n=1 Tax=Novosphingobium sp. TaxID=1874826 RepID=UPI0032B84EB8